MARLLKIEEVALTIGSSVQTINNWYRWKNLHPESEYANLLPDYFQDGPKQTRYWRSEDIHKLIEFKISIPHGRNGILGDITQKKTKLAKEKNHAKKETNKHKKRK